MSLLTLTTCNVCEHSAKYTTNHKRREGMKESVLLEAGGNLMCVHSVKDTTMHCEVGTKPQEEAQR